MRRIALPFRCIVWFFQRARTGVSEQDAWDLSRYTERMLAHGLRRLADSAHGCPASYVSAGVSVDDGTLHWQAQLRGIATELEILDDVSQADDVNDERRTITWDWLRAHWEDLWD